VTFFRLLLLACAVLALLDGAIGEAIGIAAFVAVLVWALPPRRRDEGGRWWIVRI
jgi:hypothetical protein